MLVLKFNSNCNEGFGKCIVKALAIAKSLSKQIS
jgi:hypothetical protein